MFGKLRAFLFGFAALAPAGAAVVKRLQGLGVEPVPNSPAEFQKFLREETAKYAEYVRLAKIQLE